MTTIAVTAATGQLGRLIVTSLLDEAADVVAVVRDPVKAVDVLGGRVPVRVASYEDRAALEAAFAGIDTLVLVSGSEIGHLVAQHTNAIEAAEAAGVRRIVYTSAPHADHTSLAVAREHRATEELITASGLTWTVLRNNWYHENYAARITSAGKSGVLLGSAHDGRTASAARRDYAAAAAVVAMGEGHENRVYELAGDVAWTMPQLADAASQLSGRPVEYRDLSTEDHVAALKSAGLDEEVAGAIAGMDAAVAAGTLADNTTGDLTRLIGRPSTPLVDGLQEATDS